MYFIIYKTINEITKKFYVGQHKTENINDGYLGSGSLLKRSIKKYGIENFKREILELCESKSHMNEREIYWIDKLNAKDLNIAYNITKGGEGGDWNDSPLKGTIIDKMKKSTKKFWDSLSDEDRIIQKEKMKKPKLIVDTNELKRARKLGTKNAWMNGSFTSRCFKGNNNPRYVELSDDIINSIKQDYENMILTKAEIFKKYNIVNTLFQRISKEFKHPPRCWWNCKRGIK